MSLVVVLAVMTMEPQGGVADQITNLALELPKYGVTPIILVRNPLSPGHSYARSLRDRGIDLWAIDDKARCLVRSTCIILLAVATPLVWLESRVRHKTLASSRQSLWGLLRRAGYAGLDLVFWLRLVQARRIRRAQVIHLRNPDCWPTIPWARRLGFYTIYTEDTVPQTTTNPYYDGLSRIQHSIDVITAVSRASAAALRPFLGASIPVRVVPNMVQTAPTPRPGRFPDERFEIACLARLAPQKELGTLLRAHKLALAENARLRLTIYGDGPERTHLQALAADLQIDKSVTLAGVFAKDQLPAVMQGIDVIVQSSIYEGFGVALAEGMAYGKPVVATAVGGVPEVVDDGVTGILVPARDPQALAAAILTLTRDKELYSRMAHSARERYLAYFTPEKVVPQYVVLYERHTARAR
jgi:glycosyltransferase involved in cell wall biosynthesis